MDSAKRAHVVAPAAPERVQATDTPAAETPTEADGETGRSSVFARLGKRVSADVAERSRSGRVAIAGPAPRVQQDLRSSLSRRSGVAPYIFDAKNNVEVADAALFER